MLKSNSVSWNSEFPWLIHLSEKVALVLIVGLLQCFNVKPFKHSKSVKCVMWGEIWATHDYGCCVLFHSHSYTMTTKQTSQESRARDANASCLWSKMAINMNQTAYPPPVLPFLLRWERGSLEANFSSSFHSLSHSSSVYTSPDCTNTHTRRNSNKHGLMFTHTSLLPLFIIIHQLHFLQKLYASTHEGHCCHFLLFKDSLIKEREKDYG